MTKKINKSIKEATTAKGLIKKTPVSHGVGRRKSAVARVWLRHGNGEITINHKHFVSYCSTDVAKRAVLEPIALVGAAADFSFDVNVKGGGIHSQADAIKLGISRSLALYSEEYRKLLREKGYLTVDSRIKERKKPGQAGARKKFQFVKR
jgi:small subunit ribosomal protein S9